jgi:hypothetical protein
MSGRQKFISFLRHPFRKTEPNAAKTADLRYRICFKGPCLVCPAGHAGGCTKLIERRPIFWTIAAGYGLLWRVRNNERKRPTRHDKAPAPPLRRKTVRK